MNSKRKINRIGVLTSGGDAPGMNAAIRAVVRTAIYNQLEVVGIIRGYSDYSKNNSWVCSPIRFQNYISRGTILKSSRCPEFKNKNIREKAIENLEEAGIDALVVIGGDGSFRGANLLCKEFNYPVIGIPGTIDNDIYGTDFTIGFDTAINTAVSAVDKLRDTADSHNMIFFVEVMGRDAGFIALNTAIASGADATLLPEVHTDIDKLCSFMERDRRKNKTSGIIIVAEGEEEGGAMEVASKGKQKLPNYEIRVTTLGHIQRGGSPTCNDRVLASLLGYEAVNALLKGRTNVMVGQMQNQVVYTPFEEACTRHNEINKTWYEISRILSL
jgi:6-phosphofructokinase 1